LIFGVSAAAKAIAAGHVNQNKGRWKNFPSLRSVIGACDGPLVSITFLGRAQ